MDSETRGDDLCGLLVPWTSHGEKLAVGILPQRLPQDPIDMLVTETVTDANDEPRGVESPATKLNKVQ